MGKGAYTIGVGTVKCFVHKETGENNSMFMHHFGFSEYDRNKPILTEYLRKSVRPIIDMLNDGSLSEYDAIRLLDQI